jgi:dihydrolipoamide dehydrogenase
VRVPDFDVCVIGGGPAGFAAAMRCWDFGKRIALIEKGPLGGVGVFNGALSSKTFWELSRDFRNAQRLDRGFRAEHVEVDFDRVSAVVDQACNEKTRQIARQLEALARPQPGCPGSIRHFQGTARFLDPHTLQVEGTGAGQSWRISAGHFIIATGSRPRELPGIEIDGRSIITSDHIGTLREFPRSLVILGAGVVGCEFATIFANYGRTKVYLIDRAPRILPFEDADIANLCANNLEAAGVTIHHQSKLISMRRVEDDHGGLVEYTIEHATGGREAISVEKALISVGRVPNTESLALDKAGVELGPQGHVLDEDTRTNVPHIFAAGDVTQHIALVNVGEIEGRHAAERICGLHDGALSYENLATIMFLAPEVAAIGLNEQSAQQQRIPYRVGVYDYSLVNRAIAMRDTEGFVKLLVSDDDEMKILGMRALGTHASTTLEAVSLMIQHGRSARELAELYHPHPAITEGLQDCVRMLLGSSIFKPSVFQSELRLSRVHYEDSPDAAKT